MTTLSDEGIMLGRSSSDLVIEPYKIHDVNTASYDVRLGPWFYREQEPVSHPNGPFEELFCNIYSPDTPERMWGEKQYAELASDWIKHFPKYDYRGISPRDRIIVIQPQQNLLCHTLEFIGGRRNITTAMKARSTIGRSLLNVCQCAGQGDIAFYNRWTMEVHNRSQYRSIALVVGRRIAQIVFDTTTPTQRSYVNEGKYQSSEDINEMIRNWTPEMMLPRAYKDRDIPEDAVK